jgi:hypothetical protein
LFVAAHVQAPLYYSNQNQYFLHGLAATGRGDLARDWLANTRDPTPVFSAGVAGAYSTVGESAFYGIYAVLIGVYFVSLVSLIDATLGLPRSRPARFVLLTLLVVVHAAVFRLASLYVTGTAVPQYLHYRMAAVDVPRYAQFGVAGQYLLGPGLQPSAIGVLLLASLVAFTRDRLVWAAVLTAAACAVHATYLLPAAMFTAAYMVLLLKDGRWRAALLLGLGTLLAVAPVVYCGLTEFGQTTPEQFAEAQRVLAVERIPHHTLVSRWWDRPAQAQVAWVVFAILLAWRTRLFGLMAIPAVLAAALTLVQAKTGSLPLALVFPWRISVVLVPVATAVILTRLVAFLTPLPSGSVWPGWLARAVAAAALAAVVAGGVYVSTREPQRMYPIDEAELPLLAFVEPHRKPGEVYLIPVDKGGKLEQFRLMTGAAVYVDWKSIPYRDVELLEWWRRVGQVTRWYAANDWDRFHADLVTAGITHVVIPAADDTEDAVTLEPVYEDDGYAVYRVK